MYRSISLALIMSASMLFLSTFPAATRPEPAATLIVGADRLSDLLGIVTGGGKAYDCKARLCPEFFACCIACASAADHTAEQLTADAYEGLQKIVGDQDVLKEPDYFMQRSLSTPSGPWPHRISFIMDDKKMIVTYRFAYAGGGWGETSKLFSWSPDIRQVAILLSKDRNEVRVGRAKLDLPDMHAFAKRGLKEGGIVVAAVHRSKLLEAWAASRANDQEEPPL